MAAKRATGSKTSRATKKRIPRVSPPTGGERHAGVGSDAVRNATGKGWKEWFTALDRAGARKMPHRDIARLLFDEHGVPGWWCQMITVGYEQARGMRARHEKADGYEIGRSRTIAAPVDAVFAAWKDARRRARWLADPDVTIRTATPGKALRLTWGDGKSSVVVSLTPRGASKTAVSVQHGKLTGPRAAEKMKTYWSAQLDRLQEMLEA